MQNLVPFNYMLEKECGNEILITITKQIETFFLKVPKIRNLEGGIKYQSKGF